MILGLESIAGDIFDDPQLPLRAINYISLQSCIVDGLHIRSSVTNNPIKDEWQNDTVFNAKFNGDMEAGNIAMRENTIVKLRVKRKEESNSKYRTVKEYAFDEQITTKSYEMYDYEPRGNVPLEYLVVPVDASGIEGSGSTIGAEIQFEGWWIIDLDNPEDYSFQFIYNMDSVGISTEQDRNQLETFSKYPFIRYGAKHCKQGTLSGLIFEGEENSGYSITPVWKQVRKLDEMSQAHKSYLLKDGNGHRYIVDINSPVEETNEAIYEIANVSVSWYQVGDLDA